MPFLSRSDPPIAPHQQAVSVHADPCTASKCANRNDPKSVAILIAVRVCDPMTLTVPKLCLGYIGFDIGKRRKCLIYKVPRSSNCAS